MKYIFILALFISACAEKDEQQGLQINEPIIISHDGNRQGKFNDFKSYNRSQLHNEDIISFQNTNIEFHLQIKSQCKAPNSSTIEIALNAHKPKQIKIKNILPAEVIDWMEDEAKINCEFQFIAKNSNGSVHEFSWEKMELVYEASSSNLLYTPELNEVEKDAVISYSQLQSYQFLTPKYRHTHLSCDSFKAENLKSMKIEIAKDQLQQLKNKNFRCRLLEVNSWGGIEEHSSIFYISPGSEPILITPYSGHYPYNIQGNKHKVLEWDIYNPSIQAKNISIEKNFTRMKSVYYQMWVSPNHKLGNGNAMNTQLNMSLSHDHIFMLQPGQTAKVSLYATHKAACRDKANGLMLLPAEKDDIKIVEYRHSATESALEQVLISYDLQMGNEVWNPGTTFIHRYRQEPDSITTPHPKYAPKISSKNCRH